LSNGRELTSHAIEAFLDKKLDAGCSRTLFNTYLAILASFCNWRYKKYGIEPPTKTLSRIKQGKPKQRVLSQEEYKLAMNFARGTDRDILLFLGNTGLRRDEFRKLRWGDIDPQLKFICVTGKGRKTRVVPLNTTCQDVLLKYKRLPDEETLQLSRLYPGQEGCSWMCKRISGKIGIKSFGAHAVRHYFATELIRKGVSIYKVSKILGHSSVQITESTYVHLMPVDLLGITDVLD
jgi:integrase